VSFSLKGFSMTKHRLLIVAGAVAAALAAPYAVAQSSADTYRTDTYRTPSSHWWGDRWFGDRWFGNRANQGAWINSDPDRYDGMRTWYPHPRAHIGPDNAYHSPTDGDSGGAGIPAPNGVVPSTSPLVSSGEPPYPPSRLAAGDRSTTTYRPDPLRRDSMSGTGAAPSNPERSRTDGRSGGTNLPSPQSGATPSTSPTTIR
jgi:hypothetical protein